jgi:hypothetical protein
MESKRSMSTWRIAFSVGAITLGVCVIAVAAFAFYLGTPAVDKQPPGEITLRSTVAESEPLTDSEAPFATINTPDTAASTASDPVDAVKNTDESSPHSTEVAPAIDAPKAASVNVDDVVHGDFNEATTAEPTATASIAPKANPDSDQTIEECITRDVCVDEYLWALYQRAPKEDAIKVVERRSVTIKVDGKAKTVIKEFTTVVDEDFTWKDPKAAEKAGMSLMEYVIGGMDRDFKLKLYRALRAMDTAGLAPGITSAFRDDYRQSLASGLKAASNRSYHGGSLRGGYGHGLAADLVSVKGDTRTERLASSDNLWRWIDAHGAEFGIGRPYLNKDPPHVGPIDGKEYADHRRGTILRLARLGLKKLNPFSARTNEHPN